MDKRSRPGDLMVGQGPWSPVDAQDIRQLLRALGERYPDLKPHLGDGVAIAIDGEIFQDTWLEPIPPESEVHVNPQIVGGNLAGR